MGLVSEASEVSGTCSPAVTSGGSQAEIVSLAGRLVDLNGVQLRPRPLWRQLVQGKVPLHRFLDERQAVHAV